VIFDARYPVTPVFCCHDFLSLKTLRKRTLYKKILLSKHLWLLTEYKYILYNRNMTLDDIVRAVGSQKKLADAAGVKQQAVAYWQRKNRVPVRRAKAVLEICRRHDIDVDILDLVGLGDDD